ncbi:hypothetical protein SteCoe_29722 [Stentor coeruleus]|uniref:2-methoxy-6-polyprenyl-1,4-benzoquinol methylase, mitochondrial n=1 Tax=Stentor coeruleus TaxID=5963 RepID=A0A1R2B5A4_9CILI|nr:hypothetical protein SteCoe_29722 [Stentor coeruleus]
MRLLKRLSSTVDFGAKTVAREKKQEMVNEVFTKVADKYDLMNDVMSLGIHRLWKDEFISDMGSFRTSAPLSFLDVAGGTGDIAFRISNKLKHEVPVNPPDHNKITVSDINPGMLSVGKQRASMLGLNLNWVEANAESLPFPENSFDYYTIAFGIRNVTDRLKAIKEAKRVLKKGGRFMCLEFSKVSNPVIGPFYDVYNKYLIPNLGSLVAGDKDSYQYLIESIEKFPTQEEFAKIMAEAGLSAIHYRNLTFGVVAIHSGLNL